MDPAVHGLQWAIVSHVGIIPRCCVNCSFMLKLHLQVHSCVLSFSMKAGGPYKGTIRHGSQHPFKNQLLISIHAGLCRYLCMIAPMCMVVPMLKTSSPLHVSLLLTWLISWWRCLTGTIVMWRLPRVMHMSARYWQVQPVVSLLFARGISCCCCCCP